VPPPFGRASPGETVRVRGCDLLDLTPEGRIRRKDSSGKIRGVAGARGGDALPGFCV